MPLKLIPPGRRKGNRHYYIRGTVARRPVEVSAKTADKKAAERLAIQLEARLLERRPAPHEVTFRRAAVLYCEFRRPGAEEHRRIMRLVAYLGDRQAAEIKDIDFVEAAGALYAGRTNETKNRNVFTIGAAILHYAARNDLCPWRRIAKLREKRPEARWVTEETAAILIANAEGPMRLLLVWLFRQGWRISDALAARWEHIDRQERTVRYKVAKTAEWLTVPLHDDVVALLPLDAPRFGPVFPWPHRSTANKVLRTLCEPLGLTFTFHQARHSFATWLVNRGATMNELMEAGNWRDTKSVMRYARVNPNRVREIIGRVKSGNEPGKSD